MEKKRKSSDYVYDNFPKIMFANIFFRKIPYKTSIGAAGRAGACSF
jgi:hypothetical protein